MAITVVPAEDPDQSQIEITPASTPWASSWWANQTITNVPLDTFGWLAGQGWQLTDVTFDTSTVPKTPYFTMQRESLQNMYVLQSLLNSYTIAYNDARKYNNERYNEVVEDWTEMLASSQVQFEAEISEQNTQAALYLGNLGTYMDALDVLVASNTTAMDAAIAASGTFLTDAQTNYDDFETLFGGVLALLESDYTDHASLARGFLTGLGATELARINEQFKASLATQVQLLIDRGLSSDAVTAEITERNTRDKNEAIAELNDKLNREKLANQHTLYGQQVAMRGQTLQGRERLHALAQEVLRYRQAQTLGNAEAETSHRSKAIAEMMGIAMARLQGLQGKHTENMALMAYQLEERNKLLIGLYGFVERREDVGPKFEELAKLAAGLGDSGGGWVTP